MTEIPSERILEHTILRAIGAPDLDVTDMTDEEVYDHLSGLSSYDNPRSHIEADKAIAAFLCEDLGYDRVARILRSMPVWYE